MSRFPPAAAAVAALLANHPQTRHLIVGYSGGLDSHVLLHLLATDRALRSERTLAAIHVDHNLQAASASWGEHCARVCDKLAVPFRVVKIDARPAPGESPEAAARDARYAALAAELGIEAALLTAHHRDDQAETLLLQLLRGAGPHGLAAMPSAVRFGRGWLWRPFLDVDRADLLAYAWTHHLHWIEDTSNDDTRFDRNYLRHRVLPLLRGRWPAVGRNLARSAQLCAEAASWLDAEADADLARAAPRHPDTLSLSVLCELGELRQRNTLRWWLRQLGLPLPDSRQLRHILRDTLTAGRDRQPCVRWPGGEVRRYRDTLYAMSPLPLHDARRTYSWYSTTDGWQPLDLPNVGRLRLQTVMGSGLRAGALAGGLLKIGFRQGGERFQPSGRSHGQELKKLLQEASIPPWKRDRLPLLHADGKLLAVVGLGIAADQIVSAHETGWQPVLDPPSVAKPG